MALRYIFFDFDSFFASVEQQFRPELRGKPVGIVPTLGVETTCCIAASYEAKALGIKTGTGVREARSLCPDIHFVQGDHTRYTKIHHQIKELIHQVIYVDEVLSVDEMYGRLPPHWQAPEVARQKGLEVKSLLSDKLGRYISVSIGIAPNRFIGKLASKLEKPNGLVCLDFDDLPDALYGMELSDVTGVGRSMLRRLHAARIMDMEAFCAASRRKLRRIWGSIEGERMWYALRGIEMPRDETERRSISHSHVLGRPLRSHHGAHSVLHRILQKACRRLRAMDYFTGHLQAYVTFGFEYKWAREATFFPTQDSITIAHELNRLWSERPRDAPDPTKVSVVLSGLAPANCHTPSLFPEHNHARRVELQHAMDEVNKSHGGRTIYYAEAMKAQKIREAAPIRISFTHIPDLELEDDCRRSDEPSPP